MEGIDARVAGARAKIMLNEKEVDAVEIVYNEITVRFADGSRLMFCGNEDTYGSESGTLEYRADDDSRVWECWDR